LRLIMNDTGYMHPWGMPGYTNRHPILVPVGEDHRAADIGQGQIGGQRVLTPTLQPSKDAVAVDELAVLVDREPPKDEPVLLIRRNERFTSVRSRIVNDVPESPVDNLVTQRPVRRWEPKPSRTQPTPRRTVDIRRSREEIGSLQPASLLLNG